MGHNIYSEIPTGARWQAVVGLLADGGSERAVAAAAAHAAEREFERAVRDPQFVDAAHLLAAIPAAAAGRDAPEALRRLGIDAGPDPSLPGLLGAISARLDDEASRRGAGSDFGELCRRALIAAYAHRIGDQLPGLVPPERGDVIRAAARLGGSTRFPALARDFFGTLVSQTLSNWLDRILPTQVGGDLRFEGMADRDAFGKALDRHVSETTRIIQEFSVGWYGKALHDEGMITRARAHGFGAHAMTKIRAELARRL